MDTSSFMQTLASNAASAAMTSEDRKPNPLFQVLLLNNVSVARMKEKESVRVNFMVLKTLAVGFSSANVNLEKKPAPGTKAPQRNPKDLLYNPLPSRGGCLVKTYNNIRKGVRGEASENSAAIIPGMILETTVFSQEYLGVFGPEGVDRNGDWQEYVQADIPAFTVCVAQLQSRSSAAKATLSGNLMQLRHLVPKDIPLVFGNKVGFVFCVLCFCCCGSCGYCARASRTTSL